MKTLFTLFSLFLILSITSCSKEKKTERVLHRTGSWEVAELDWTIVSQGVTDTSLIQGTLSGSETNAGTFYFDKDGSGSYLITYNEIPKNGSFRWSVNSNGTVTIIETTSLINSFINTTISWVNEDFSVIQEAYSFTFDQTGDKIFTGDGAGALQILNAGETLLGQYGVNFDHIKLVEK
jgi:hypothetical protein